MFLDYLDTIMSKINFNFFKKIFNIFLNKKYFKNKDNSINLKK
jgi:hypothetical protein